MLWFMGSQRVRHDRVTELTKEQGLEPLTASQPLP